MFGLIGYLEKVFSRINFSLAFNNYPYLRVELITWIISLPSPCRQEGGLLWVKKLG